MMEKRAVLVQNVIEESIDVVTIHAGNKGLQLICDLDFPVGLCIMADHGRLRQVLINLLSNAIKFTEKGEIVVGGRVTGTAEMLEIWVKDSGIGINKKFHKRIFSPFLQSDSSITRRFVGSDFLHSSQVFVLISF